MTIRRILTIADSSGRLTFRDLCRDPSLIWQPWLSANFHIQRNDLVAHNVTLSEIIAMWDAVKA